MIDARIAVLASDPRQTRSEMPDAPASAPLVHSLDELANRPDIKGLIIDCPSGLAAASRMRALRSHPKLCLMPLFLHATFDPWVMVASDGSVKTWAHAEKRAGEINEMLATLPPVEAMDEDEALLRFLYSRPATRIAPMKSYASAKLYRYPLLEAFSKTQADLFVWLNSLLGRRLLEAANLVTRVRTCPRCSNAHLNYLDRCPNCKSVDIRQKLFLHCFTCGNVAPQEEFRREGALDCPKCEAHLSHIGADYDRALENYQCHSCRHVFTDPEVVAACLNCDHIAALAELEKIEIHEFRLSERGSLAVRGGNLQNIYAIFDRLNYVEPEYFSKMTDWALLVGQRHKEQKFSLLQLHLENVRELVATLGNARAAQLLESFAERLRQLIRTTDLSTRLAENVFVLLLPQTSGPQAAVLRGRILGLVGDAQLPDGKSLRISVKTYSFPEQYLKGETADLVLSRLGAEPKAAL
jgi:GGDEF domain-containing protein/DNA-directed RNA polymerase subunit M/transcription elongation factor TFIIS